MKQKLFGNTKRMTTAFAVTILVLTLVVLVLRVTLLGDFVMASDTDIQTVENEHISYALNHRIYFANPTAKGNPLLSSDAANTNYLTLSIASPDFKNPLLTTGFLQPGNTLDRVELDGTEQKNLAEGVYPCTATIKVFDPVSRELLSTEEREVTIYIGVQPDQSDNQ